MKSNQSERERLLDALSRKARELSTWTVLFHEAVADRLGLNVTDLRCLDFVSREGAVTAGQLAGMTGLTTGAITGVIDRLEKAGLARRERDINDRRRVIVHPLQEPIDRQVGPLYNAMSRAMARLATQYRDEELALILQYMREASLIVKDETARMREASGST